MALYFISGKGGVGKTHLATSLSLHLASSGRRTQLVEFSKFAQYPEYFGQKIGFEPVNISENFHVSSWTGLDCLHEYAAKVLHSKKAADLFFKLPLMTKLSRVAPGLKEIAVLGKITSDYRESGFATDFDDIVFDYPASGHFLSMMKVPKSLGDTVGAGPMKRQCESIQAALLNHRDVHFALVADGGKFSEIELEETGDQLKKFLPKKQVHVIHNKSDAFPETTSTSWLKSATKMSALWEAFSWK